MPLLFFISIGMALFVDFGIGTFIAALVSRLTGIVPEQWHLLAGGILAFLPDFDIIAPILRKRYEEVGEHHETLMHRPALVLLFVTIAAWILGGPMWATIAFLCVLWHYVHDTRGLGGIGTTWFWPFSQKAWDFRGAHKIAPQPPVDAWLREYWLVPSALSIREISIGALALSAALWLTYGFAVAVIAMAVTGIGTAAVWLVYRTIK